MPDMRFNFPVMRDMKRACENTAAQIDDSVDKMKAVAQQMEDGALHGKGGDRAKEAVRNTLIPKMQLLSAKLREQASDIQKSIEEGMRVQGDDKRLFDEIN